MNAPYSITFDPERCIACFGCVTACQSWNNLPPNTSFRKLKTLWQNENSMPRIRHASVACMHCTNPACIPACPKKAIHKNNSGLVLVNETLCISCRACQKACPFNVPNFPDNGPMKKCDLCHALVENNHTPPCVATCPTRALSLSLTSIEEKLKAEYSLLSLLSSNNT